MAVVASTSQRGVGDQARQHRGRRSGRRRPPCPGRSPRPAGSTRPATGAATAGGDGPLAELGVEQPVALDDAAAQGLAEARPAPRVISFSRKCGASPRSMSRVVISATCTSASVRPAARCRRRPAGGCRRAARPVRRRARTTWPRLPRLVGPQRRLAVHAQVAGGLLDQAVRLAGHDEGVLGQPDVEALAAAPQRQQTWSGSAATDGADGHRALEGRDRAPERLGEVGGAAAPARDTRAGMTLASVVIGGRDAQAAAGLQVGVVVDVAVQRGDHVRPAAIRPPPRWLTGWALASEMMPTLAQRVWPSTVDAGRGDAEREVEQPVVADGGPQRRGVVAQLADLGRRLVDERRALPSATRTAPEAKRRIVVPAGQQPGRPASARRGRGRGPRRAGAARPSPGPAPRAGRWPRARAGPR